MQVPDEYAGQNCIDPIADAGDGRVSVDTVNGYTWFDARSLAIGVSCPKIGRGSTLKHKEKEEAGAVELSRDQSDVDDKTMDGFDGQTKEHQGYTGFDGHIG